MMMLGEAKLRWTEAINPELMRQNSVSVLRRMKFVGAIVEAIDTS